MCFSRAATKKEIEASGVTVAALFFKKVFGVQAQRALSIFVALRFSDILMFCRFGTDYSLSVLLGELRLFEPFLAIRFYFLCACFLGYVAISIYPRRDTIDITCRM